MTIKTPWTGPGTHRHDYSPDLQAMGDCRTCGHVQEAHEPWSSQAAQPAPSQAGTSRQASEPKDAAVVGLLERLEATGLQSAAEAASVIRRLQAELATARERVSK